MKTQVNPVVAIIAIAVILMVIIGVVWRFYFVHPVSESAPPALFPGRVSFPRGQAPGMSQPSGNPGNH